MKLFQNTINGLRFKHWTLLEAFAYFLKGMARELKIAPDFFLKFYKKVVNNAFNKKWLIKKDNENSYYDFKGAIIPDISTDKKKLYLLAFIFEDVFLIPCYYNDIYDKKVVELLDKCMSEGPYGYSDGSFDVTIKKDDVVIDAGAWIGDFSAYTASKGAISYAFEPIEENFNLLCKTVKLNNGKIYPVKKGLGSNECELNILINKENSASNSIFNKEDSIEEKINLTTLDKFVKDNKIEKIDFIKADIEGAERDMLKGATNVLKMFAPKLAICTYHLPDDPEVLEKVILEANPNYKIVQLRHKLFAAV